MKYINQLSKIQIKLTLLKEASPDIEDLSEADYYAVFLYHGDDIQPLTCTITDGVIITPVLENLSTGVVGLRVLWAKDKTLYPVLRKLMRVDMPDLFAITTDEEEAEESDTTVIVNVKKRAHVFGFDGLSAYEKAVLLGKTTLKESEWVANVSEMNDKFNELEKELDDQYETREKARDALFNENEADRAQEAADAEALREETFTANEGASSDAPSETGSRWARFLYWLQQRYQQFYAALGTYSDTASYTSSMWAYLKASLGTPNDTAGTTSTIWAYAKKVFSQIQQLFDSILGTSSSTDSATIWGKYNISEGTESGSTAGDGSRWGAFKTAETTREAECDDIVAKANDILYDITVTDEDFEIASGSYATDWIEVDKDNTIQLTEYAGVSGGTITYNGLYYRIKGSTSESRATGKTFTASGNDYEVSFHFSGEGGIAGSYRLTERYNIAEKTQDEINALEDEMVFWTDDEDPTEEVEGAMNIVDNLTDGGHDEALSAEQGKILKGLVDAEVTRAKAAEATKLTDATSDGKVYARQSGAWVEIPYFYMSGLVLDDEAQEIIETTTGDIGKVHDAAAAGMVPCIMCKQGKVYFTCSVHEAGSGVVFTFEHNGYLYKVTIDGSNVLTLDYSKILTASNFSYDATNGTLTITTE